MVHLHRFKIICASCMLLLLLGIIWLSWKPLKPNEATNSTTLIPNIVHYVLFNRSKLNFINYLSILSTLKVQKPSDIFIHTNSQPLVGTYWNRLKRIQSNTTITSKFLPQPTHVYGQLLSSVYHASDVARIQVLQKFGGIYLDLDVIVINNFDKLRHHSMVVGWPENDYMGTQVLLANKDSGFLKLWLSGYQNYKPRDWYYNAGRFPTDRILNVFPHLVHREKVLLGVENLLDKLNSRKEWNWREFFCVHLLSRHEPFPINVNETLVKDLNTNFGEIARWVLKL